LIDRLHTDVLEEKYGKVHAEILRHDDQIREIHICDQEGISRTYALTFLTFDSKDEEVTKINEEIKNGELIGQAFKKYGYSIRKNVVTVYTLNLPEWLKNEFRVVDDKAKARLSEFYAKKEGKEPFIYGVVTEIYSPDFRPAEVNDIDVQQDNPTTNALEKVGFTKENIWDRLGSGNEWLDEKDKFAKAQELASTEELNLEDRVRRFLDSK